MILERLDMLKRLRAVALIAVLLVINGGQVVSGTNATELMMAFEAMYQPKLDTATTVAFPTPVHIEHQNLELIFQSGRMAFFKPVVIDSVEKVFGAYFEGQGQLRFAPPVDMEKEQLQRFYRTDSLDRSFDKMLLLFSDEIYQTIIDSTLPAVTPFTGAHVKASNACCEHLTRDDHRGYIFEALSNLVHPAQRPFLLINTEPDKSDRVFYIFNPDRREEVRFLKSFSQPGIKFMELICQYSQYVDSAYVNLNGLSKDRILTKSYTIDSEIDSDANFRAKASMTFEVTAAPTYMLRMDLHPELAVDSVRDSTGQKVGFYRYGDKEEKSSALYLFFDRPLSARETVTLEFFYHGDIIYYSMGQCFLRAGADWYPRYGYAQRALFTLNFKTSKRFAFVATGSLVGEDKLGDTVFTSWRVAPPASNVSFNVGMLQKTSFEEPDIATVDVYFSEELHKLLGRELAAEMIPTGRDMPGQVAEDISNALRLYNEIFGPYPYRKMVVGEILQPHAEAFPGFLHLGYYTWINTDSWGYDRALRAHEVAHQWWGVGVGYQTYHDQWLSEGLAEYSSLMYLQAVAGNDLFMDRLKEYRTDIFSARQYLFGSGEEAGPIALGYRTASTKTSGDYDLVVYKKAAMVLHMLRNLLVDLRTMNEDRFRTMMKDLYQTYRGQLITTRDFRRLVEKHAGVDMGWFFDQWIYRSELPTYEFSYTLERDSSGTYTAHGKIVTTGVRDDFRMFVPLELEIDADSKAYVRLFVDSPVFEFSLPDLPRRPRALRLNPFESVLARVKQ